VSDLVEGGTEVVGASDTRLTHGVDVHEKIVNVPIGPWAKDPKQKEVGRYQRELMTMGVEPYTFGFIGKLLGWSEDECRVLIAKVVSEMRDKSLHLYVRFFFTYGRKPETAS
jgi:hypothetical protein